MDNNNFEERESGDHLANDETSSKSVIIRGFEHAQVNYGSSTTGDIGFPGPHLHPWMAPDSIPMEAGDIGLPEHLLCVLPPDPTPSSSVNRQGQWSASSSNAPSSETHFACIRRFYTRIGRILANPSDVLCSKYFFHWIWTLTVFEVIVMTYGILLSAFKKKCFQDLLSGDDRFFLVPGFLSMFHTLVRFFYMYFVAASRYSSHIIKQELKDANRGRLAMCTKELCEAQKLRIRKTNCALDTVTLIWLGSLITYRIVVVNPRFCNLQFDDDQESSLKIYGCVRTGPCQKITWTFVMSATGVMLVGIVLKFVFICSEHDYTVQSRAFEVQRTNAKVQNPLKKWYHLPEYRAVATCKASLVVVPLYFCANVLNNIYNFDVVGPVALKVIGTILGYAVNFFDCICIMLVFLDGSLLFWPSAVFSLFCLPTVLNDAQQITHWRNPFALRSLARRKAVLSFYLFVAVPSGLMSFVSHNGAEGNLYQIGGIWLALAIVLFVSPVFFVSDKEESVESLLASSTNDNFGLLLSRKALVSEFERVIKCLPPHPPKIDVSIPTYLASQARMELSIAISYRWLDERQYDGERSANPPRFLYLKNTKCDGFDWDVMITEEQATQLVEKLSSLAEDYVWMDQFSIPQSKRFCSDSGPYDMSYEEKKEEVRCKLIPKMTGLYSCARKVVILNNHWDPALRDQDLYTNRLWCCQEYCFAIDPSIMFLPKQVSEPDQLLRFWYEERKEVCRKWFGSTCPVSLTSSGEFRMKRRASDVSESAKEGLDVILDWMVVDPDVLKRLICDRVEEVGCRKYFDLVKRKFASNYNDTLSALAQPWFGIIMTKSESKALFVHALVDEALKTGEHEVEVISNQCEYISRMTGTFSIERMFSNEPAGMETGCKVKVVIICDGIKNMQHESPALQFQCIGQIIDPPGWQTYIAKMTFLMDPSCLNDSIPACRLLQLKFMLGVPGKHPDPGWTTMKELSVL